MTRPRGFICFMREIGTKENAMLTTSGPLPFHIKPNPMFRQPSLVADNVRQDRWSRRVTNNKEKTPCSNSKSFTALPIYRLERLDILPAISDACKMSTLAFQPASRTARAALPCRTGSPEIIGWPFLYEKTALPSSGGAVFSAHFPACRRRSPRRNGAAAHRRSCINA